MGLTTGHVFSDGDTVTAAKLNAMVNDATIDNATITPSMIQDDAIETRHISDGAITSNHLTSGAVSIGAVESGQTTEGYLIQTDPNGDLTTLNVGAAGTVLVSGGAETAPSFTTLGASGVSSAMVSDHDKLEAPNPSDLVFAKSISAGVNKRLEIQDLYRTVNGLTALSASDMADADELLVLDGGNPKKITKANLESALGGGQLPSSGSNYYSGTSSTLYDVLNSASKTAVFTHGLGATPRLVRMVVLCDSDDSSGHGYSVGDEIEIANLYYWDGDNYQTPAATVTSDSSTIQAQFNYVITAAGFQLVLMQKTQISGGPAQGSAGGPGTLNFGTAYYFSNKSGADTSRFKLKVYAWA